MNIQHEVNSVHILSILHIYYVQYITWSLTQENIALLTW